MKDAQAYSGEAPPPPPWPDSRLRPKRDVTIELTLCKEDHLNRGGDWIEGHLNRGGDWIAARIQVKNVEDKKDGDISSCTNFSAKSAEV